MVTSRWVVLSASLLAEIVGGAMYAFPVYSEQLRISLGYAQWQVSSLAMASNVGNFCNIPSGIVQDRCGTRATIMCGVFFNFLGYFLLYLVAAGTIVVPYPVVVGISVLWGNGSGWFDTAVITVNMGNFPEKRGVVVGLLKAFFGLSSAILSLIYFSFFNSMGAPANANNFILCE
jgi:fucose permease